MTSYTPLDYDAHPGQPQPTDSAMAAANKASIHHIILAQSKAGARQSSIADPSDLAVSSAMRADDRNENPTPIFDSPGPGVHGEHSFESTRLLSSQEKWLLEHENQGSQHFMTQNSTQGLETYGKSPSGGTASRDVFKSPSMQSKVVTREGSAVFGHHRSAQPGGEHSEASMQVHHPDMARGLPALKSKRGQRKLFKKFGAKRSMLPENKVAGSRRKLSVQVSGERQELDDFKNAAIDYLQRKGSNDSLGNMSDENAQGQDLSKMHSMRAYRRNVSGRRLAGLRRRGSTSSGSGSGSVHYASPSQRYQNFSVGQSSYPTRMEVDRYLNLAEEIESKQSEVRVPPRDLQTRIKEHVEAQNTKTMPGFDEATMRELD